MHSRWTAFGTISPVVPLLAGTIMGGAVFFIAVRRVSIYLYRPYRTLPSSLCSTISSVRITCTCLFHMLTRFFRRLRRFCCICCWMLHCSHECPCHCLPRMDAFLLAFPTVASDYKPVLCSSDVYCAHSSVDIDHGGVCCTYPCSCSSCSPEVCAKTHD